MNTNRGFSLLSLLMWGIVIAFAALLGMKLWPAVTEYMTTKSAVQKLEATLAPGATESDVRKAFDQQKTVEYQIGPLAGKDLVIEPREGGGVSIGFAYDREVHLFGPAYVLLKYRYGPQD